MTHTLHRKGTEDNLKDDFIVLAMFAKGINADNSAEKICETLRILSRYDYVNLGDMNTGNIFEKSLEEIIDNVKDTSIVHAVFRERDEMVQAISALREADLGISVVVSGLFGEVGKCCREVGVSPHTREYSLGIMGRKDRLPAEWILEITTMCGHGLVSQGLVKEMAERIKHGRIDLENASIELSKPCQCGVFNVARSKVLLGEAAKRDV